MSTWFALEGEVSRELLTYGGRVIIHPDPRELEFLVRGAVRVRRMTGPSPQFVADHLGRPVLELRHHPAMRTVRWPLDRRQFVGQ